VKDSTDASYKYAQDEHNGTAGIRWRTDILPQVAGTTEWCPYCHGAGKMILVLEVWPEGEIFYAKCSFCHVLSPKPVAEEVRNQLRQRLQQWRLEQHEADYDYT
jgi:hypothetical protein